jgi:Tfp pilus assembly protein PilF
MAARFVCAQPDCQGPPALASQKPAAPVLNALGAHFANAKNLRCAIQSFERAIAADPKSVEAHFNLGLALLDAGNPARAAQSFQAALQLNPNLHAARNALATVLTE